MVYVDFEVTRNSWLCLWLCSPLEIIRATQINRTIALTWNYAASQHWLGRDTSAEGGSTSTNGMGGWKWDGSEGELDSLCTSA